MGFEGKMTIDLGALCGNWRALARRNAGETGAVVKAGAYGLGLERVAPALHRAGCQTFFVAQLSEGIALRALLPTATIFVLEGFHAGHASAFASHRLKPVLSSLEDLQDWLALSEAAQAGGAALHVDSGMNRLGLRVEEALALAPDQPGVDLIFSHFVEGEKPSSALTQAQIKTTRQIKAHFSPLPFSLANSGGFFMAGMDFSDLGRPGVVLYGDHGFKGAEGIREVVTLEAPVLQVRKLLPGESVGYGATFRADQPMLIATVGIGYADGFSRLASSGEGGAARAFGHFQGQDLPVIGRVSMDTLALDVSCLSPGAIQRGDLVEMLGANMGLSRVAEAHQTISYEILTRLGTCRFTRIYLPDASK